jgi:LysM repeat protein
MLAPASLALFAVIVLVVVVSSLGGGSSGSGDSKRSQARPAQGSRSSRLSQPAGASTGQTAGRRFYVVKAGDTLGTIAQRTGVTVEQLLSLNPSADPQGLVTGQRIKLRE